MYRKVSFLKSNLQISQLGQLRSITHSVEKVSDESHAKNHEWEQAKPFKSVPGPSKFQFVRNFLPGGRFYKKPINEFLEKSRQIYGDLHIFPGFLGRPDLLMSYNPDDMLTILRSEGVWPHRRGLETMTYYREVHRKIKFEDGIVGLVGVNNEAWGKFRSLVNPILMQPKNAKLYLNNMLEVSDEFLERIREIRDPKTLEVPDTFEDEINRLTFESVAVVALNRQFGLIRKNRDHEAKEVFESLRSFFELSVILDMGPPIWKYIKTKQFHQMMKNYDTLSEISTKYVNEAIERIENDQTSRKENEEKSVLEKLLKVNRSVAKIMASDLLMAGVDTTSSTLTGILLCIAKNPEKQEKLRQEIREILPHKDSLLTIENMKNLPYLRASIKEGLRIYPIGSGTIRCNSEDIVLSGYKIPKGQEIIINHNFLLNTEKYCPKPKEYIPERWLRKEECQDAPIYPFLYMPFSHGPRSCVGKRIVELELEITVARLVRNFYIEFNYSTENAFKNRLINVPAIPLKFKFTEVEQ